MESFARESTADTILLPCFSESRPTWLAVDLRFVIATIVLFGAVLAAIIRFSHEVFDPLAESFMLRGWAAVIVRPSLLASRLSS